jgi:hypothetical protein
LSSAVRHRLYQEIKNEGRKGNQLPAKLEAGVVVNGMQRSGAFKILEPITPTLPKMHPKRMLKSMSQKHPAASCSAYTRTRFWQYHILTSIF